METIKKSRKKVKRVFLPFWCHDDKFKSWIREVPHDKSLFYCSFCDKTFSCGSSNVKRHAESARHKYIVSKKSERRSFMPQWLENEDFKPWLHNVVDDPFSWFCSICNIKSFSCRLSIIKHHADSTYHVENCTKNGIDQSKSNDDLTMQSEESPLSFDDRRKCVEIRFAALVAELNISHQAAESILEFFQDVGSDSQVLKSLTVGRTKLTNIITKVLYPRESERVNSVLQNSKFSVFIDETSDSTNEKWMTFLVRYVAPETLDVRTELVELINLDARDCSAGKIFDAFKHSMYKRQIPFQNILALSCDNASVMTGQNSSFMTKLAEIRGEKFFTMRCPCHSSALVVRAACATIPEECEELLRKVATYIYSSPKRSAHFRDFQQCFQTTDRKISKLCSTRWLSHHLAVVTVLENWDSLWYFLLDMVVSEKTKSGEHLLKLMQNPEMKAYLFFLKYVLERFNKFNVFCQAQETRIHLLQRAAMSLLYDMLHNFLEPRFLKDMNSLKSLNFSERDKHLALDSVEVGADCAKYLCRLIEEGKPEIVQTVRKNCVAFYVTAAEEIRNRLPIDDKFLSQLRVFEPRSALCDIDRDNSFRNVLYVAQKFDGFDEDGLRQEWSLLHLDFATQDKQKLTAMNFDGFWKTILLTQNEQGLFKYPELMKLLNSIRALPNSNADPERSFSMLPDVKTKKRNKLSSSNVNSICVVKSALKARGVKAQTMEIDDKHLCLMSSENLYASSVKKQSSKLRLHAAHDDGLADFPSSSYNAN